MSSLKWLSGLSMPEPPGNTSRLDDLDRPTPLPQRVRGATLTPEYLAELDEPVPYVPVDLIEDDGTEAEAVAHVSPPVAALRFSHPAPSPSGDLPALVQMDQAEAHAESRLIKAALAWEASEHGAPWDHADAEDELRAAAHDYRNVVAR
jgi:hypothetical protein